ncbi:hypothetical protein EVG20_g3424 [Dentipellis fragilis]|uniref:Uncharacterized protein n=1 Tax=Dentipellis fragilis TaxID=205917 RepID=A0A4Y9Z4Q8_9AGAM|nr:hypothetical protein EVG20_g3424 [Dentipellis fragilis]
MPNLEKLTLVSCLPTDERHGRAPRHVVLSRLPPFRPVSRPLSPPSPPPTAHRPSSHTPTHARQREIEIEYGQDTNNLKGRTNTSSAPPPPLSRPALFSLAPSRSRPSDRPPTRPSSRAHPVARSRAPTPLSTPHAPVPLCPCRCALACAPAHASSLQLTRPCTLSPLLSLVGFTPAAPRAVAVMRAIAILPAQAIAYTLAVPHALAVALSYLSYRHELANALELGTDTGLWRAQRALIQRDLHLAAAPPG